MLHLILLLFLFIFPTPTAAAAPPAYSPTDFILLSCGATSTLNDTFSKRSWDGDDRSRYLPWNAATVSSSSTASSMDSSVSQVPFQTVRVFRSSFTYTFPLSEGYKFIRLYFYPAIYSDLDTSQYLFSVTANTFHLLTNFSASLYSQNTSQPSFSREFVINVGENQKLDLTFSPNPDSLAFVNGIEIVSMPDTLYFKGDDVGIKRENGVYFMNSNTAMEKLYRLNVGGSRVEIQDDSGMFRAWTPDDDYINYGYDYGFTPRNLDIPINYTAGTPPYSAPEIVYRTSRVMGNHSKSLDWVLPVDSGFNYLLRLHFCEIQLEVTMINQRVFSIAIENKTMDTADIIVWTGGNGIPIYKDYIAWVPNDNHRLRNLQLSLFPYGKGNQKYQNALLNGLEIFKLNDSSGSLAAANPVTSPSPPSMVESPGRKKSGGSSVIYGVVGGVIGVVALVVTASLLIFLRKRKVKDSMSTTIGDQSSWIPPSIVSSSTTRTSGSGLQLPSDLCKFFSLDEIQTATRNFDDNFVIGKGGFGNVYRGFTADGASVAIKRLKATSNQGAHEFLTEIRMLSKLRHLHLVSLIGYCDEYGEMILVYDHMAHGTLRDHLYKSKTSPLTWLQRLQICLGAAKGLHYLHTGANPRIIHRDVKSSNILLDEKWVAKMSDFGLSKIGPTGGAHTHVSTVVKGSFGYVDPEYYRRQQLTEKSDVYSFGVVLLEVLCGRPPIIASLPREQVHVAEWAKLNLRKGTTEEIVDSNLKGQIAVECLSKFIETAVGCVRDKGIDRPAMSDVVWSLELAIQLQETAASRDGGNVAEGGDATLSSSNSAGIVDRTSTEEEMFSNSYEGGSKSSDLSSTDKLRSGDVFSEIANPLGR